MKCVLPNGSDNIEPDVPVWAFVNTTVCVVEPKTLQTGIAEGTACIVFTCVVLVTGTETKRLVVG